MVIGVFTEIAPLLKQCPNVVNSRDEQFKKVASMLEIFDNPSYTALVNVALASYENLDDVGLDLKLGMLELREDHCSASGKAFGRILKRLIESDASLSKYIWWTAEKVVEIGTEKVKYTTSKAVEMGTSSVYYAIDWAKQRVISTLGVTENMFTQLIWSSEEL